MTEAIERGADWDMDNIEADGFEGVGVAEDNRGTIEELNGTVELDFEVVATAGTRLEADLVIVCVVVRVLCFGCPRFNSPQPQLLPSSPALYSPAVPPLQCFVSLLCSTLLCGSGRLPRPARPSLIFHEYR